MVWQGEKSVRRDIKTGISNLTKTIILEGLKVGDEVVSSSSSKSTSKSSTKSSTKNSPKK